MKERIHLLYSDFLKNIKSNDIDSAYLFFGQEEYLMNTAIDQLNKKFVGGVFEEINFVRIEGKDAEFDTLMNACETLPFMSEKKLVVLRDVLGLLENLDKGGQDELYKYLDDLGDHLCLVLMDNTDSIRKNSKLYRYFNKNKRAVDFSKLAGRELNQWIEGILRKHKKSMSFSDISYFIEHSSYRSRNIDLSLYDLENELLKVINHSRDEEIDKASIDAVLIESVDTNIFDLLDAIGNMDSSKAMDAFNDMYMSNEPVQRIFYMITRQIRLLLGFKLYREKGYNQSQIQSKLGIGNFEFRKISSQSNRWSLKRLEDIMEELLNIDIMMKTTSSNDKLLIEILLVKLCSK